MTTRAANIQFLLAGMSNPTTGLPVAGGTVYFYEAGTTTQKYVWTEIAKTNGYYSASLDAVGAVQLYGEGNYKIVVKDSAGATVYTLDNVRLEYPYYGIRSVTQTGNQLSQDDFLLVDTSGGAVTINCLAAASWLRPLKIQRIAGSNNITVDPNSTETIDGASTLTISDDSIVEIISDGSNLRSAGFRSSTTSSDGTSAITVGNDSITMDVGGTEDILDLYTSGAFTVYISGGLSVVSGGISSSSTSNAFTGGTIYPTTLKVNEDVAVTATSTEINNICDGAPNRLVASEASLTINSSYSSRDTLDLGTLTSGDSFLVCAYLIGNKGGTAGDVNLGLSKSSGTGAATFANSAGSPQIQQYSQASTTVFMCLTIPGYVGTSGTYVLSIDASSTGSDISNGTLRTEVIFHKKQ